VQKQWWQTAAAQLFPVADGWSYAGFKCKVKGKKTKNVFFN